MALHNHHPHFRTIISSEIHQRFDHLCEHKLKKRSTRTPSHPLRSSRLPGRGGHALGGGGWVPAPSSGLAARRDALASKLRLLLPSGARGGADTCCGRSLRPGLTPRINPRGSGGGAGHHPPPLGPPPVPPARARLRHHLPPAPGGARLPSAPLASGLRLPGAAGGGQGCPGHGRS